MKEVIKTCPNCGKATSTVSLGTEKPRSICGRFGCSWDGQTLQPVE